jgi:uncharacterized protein YcfL
MKRTALLILVVAAAGCRRDHIRTYDLEPQALVLIEDEHQRTRSIDVGDSYLVTSDRESVVVVRNTEQTKYPLRKGWHVTRDDDSFTIEEVPLFKPY